MEEGLEEAAGEQSQEVRNLLGGAAAAVAIAAAEAVKVTRRTYCRSGAVRRMFVLGEVIEDLSWHSD